MLFNTGKPSPSIEQTSDGWPLRVAVHAPLRSGTRERQHWVSQNNQERMRRRCLLLTLAALASPCSAQVETERQNWFNDPFFQISAAVPNCPLPAGPFITEAERKAESHHRAEKGTTCWLAGKCDLPNSSDYDKDIAAALQTALAERNPFANTTLWVTIQGRVVYIEVCATSGAVAAKLEAFAKKLPNVQQALAIVRTDSSARAPYKLRSDR